MNGASTETPSTYFVVLVALLYCCLPCTLHSSRRSSRAARLLGSGWLHLCLPLRVAVTERKWGVADDPQTPHIVIGWRVIGNWGYEKQALNAKA